MEPYSLTSILAVPDEDWEEDRKRTTELSETVEQLCISVKNITNDQLLEKEYNHHAIMKSANTIRNEVDLFHNELIDLYNTLKRQLNWLSAKVKTLIV